MLMMRGWSGVKWGLTTAMMGDEGALQHQQQRSSGPGPDLSLIKSLDMV